MQKYCMQYYVCILLIVALLPGCATDENASQTSDPDIISEEMPTGEIAGSTEDTESDVAGATEIELESEKSYYESLVHGDYFDLEEGINMASYVVAAKCMQVYSDVQYTYAVFAPVNTLKGEIKEDTIIVRGNNHATIYVDEYIYVDDVARYEMGEEYLLVLDRYISVYNEYDYYQRLGGIFISRGTLEGATMFGYASIVEMLQNTNIVCENYKGLVDYVENIIKENPTGTGSNGTDYIRSDKLEDIVEQTKTILRVKITDHWVIGNNKDREDCYCIVEETLKGEEITGEINVVVPYESVNTGEEYIFLLSKVHETSGFYIMSSKNSVYSVEDVENVGKIRALINITEAER